MLSNLLNQDHTANKRQRQGQGLNPKSEPRAQKLNQHAETKLTRANKGIVFFFWFTYSFNEQEHSTYSVAYSIPGPDLWARGEIQAITHGVYLPSGM